MVRVSEDLTAIDYHPPSLTLTLSLSLQDAMFEPRGTAAEAAGGRGPTIVIPSGRHNKLEGSPEHIPCSSPSNVQDWSRSASSRLTVTSCAVASMMGGEGGRCGLLIM